MCLPGEWWWVRALLSEYQHRLSLSSLISSSSFTDTHLYICSNAFSSHLSFHLFIFFLCLLYRRCPLSASEAQFGAFLLPHSPGGLLPREEGERVIAVCRWRACGSCWLWTLLYARGWMKRRIGVRLWPCCSETPPLSRSHKVAWLEPDCGLRAPDPRLLRPLVLKTTHIRLKTKSTTVSHKCWLDRCFTEQAWGDNTRAHTVSDYMDGNYKQTCCCKNCKHAFFF